MSSNGNLYWLMDQVRDMSPRGQQGYYIILYDVIILCDRPLFFMAKWSPSTVNVTKNGGKYGATWDYRMSMERTQSCHLSLGLAKK